MLKTIVLRQPQAEVSVRVLVRADWFARSRILGLAQCRRPCCHHLILEFLSVPPAIVGRAAPVRGVGTGLLYGLVELGGSMGMPLIWGAATALSAPFYAKALAVREITATSSSKTRSWRTAVASSAMNFLARLDFGPATVRS